MDTWTCWEHSDAHASATVVRTWHYRSTSISRDQKVWRQQAVHPFLLLLPLLCYQHHCLLWPTSAHDLHHQTDYHLGVRRRVNKSARSVASGALTYFHFFLHFLLLLLLCYHHQSPLCAQCWRRWWTLYPHISSPHQQTTTGHKNEIKLTIKSQNFAITRNVLQ